jgi:hypothetical protein
MEVHCGKENSGETDDLADGSQHETVSPDEREFTNALVLRQLRELLRAWWSQCRSRGWLFPGQDPLRPITVRGGTSATRGVE